MPLHLIYSPSAYAACEPRMGTDDVLLLLGDGVYLAAKLPHAFALQDDCELRGIAVPNTVDYDGMVALTEAHAPVITWRDA